MCDVPWMDWYQSLAKPSWTPATRTISLIWQILHSVISAACGVVFVQAGRGRVPLLVAWCGVVAVGRAGATDPFRIEIIDRENGWPVPLVELRTVHGVTFVSDNAGLIACDLPESMGEETWCGIRGFGYGVPRDGFGFEGVRFTPQPGGRLRVQVDRRIVAKRLGRITGAGVFGESRKLGEDKDWCESGIVGCDSVQNAVFDGRLFWLWGDTSLAKYPLGVFDGTAAHTPLRPLDCLEPPVRMPFNFYRDAAGAPKPIAKMPGTGPTWVTGLARVPDATGVPRLVGTFMKIKPPLEAYRVGLCVWEPEQKAFSERTVLWEQSGQRPREQPLLEGHAVEWTDTSGKSWLLFGNPFPAIRCPATFEAWADPATWEPLEAPRRLHDASGQPVVPHSGSIAWNPWRHRWVAVFMEKFGKPSAFGEIWYAEAESALGPWGPAVKIVSHDNYTFYNPRLHPEFTEPDSPTLIFEATFTQQFADKPAPVARYDYNQVLYRLELDDPALAAAH
ncbi:MAG: tryptophan-rich sensory protein [Planctomycetaceae bacterium]